MIQNCLSSAALSCAILMESLVADAVTSVLEVRLEVGLWEIRKSLDDENTRRS